uniref:Uncharacterized protein n=1 Tax=Anopheles minimus TaxID=112268 RepID=A0A182WP95_9DIPT
MIEPPLKTRIKYRTSHHSTETTEG